jgi:uncharacterized membrane protein
MPLAEFTFGDVVLSIFVLMFMLMYLTLFIFLFMDIFGREDLSGWGKAGWVLLLFVLPLLGSLIYIVTRSVSRSHEAVQSMPYGGGAVQQP